MLPMSYFKVMQLQATNSPALCCLHSLPCWPCSHTVQEIPRNLRLLARAQLAPALGEPGCLLAPWKSISAAIPKPKQCQVPQPHLQVSPQYCRTINAQAFCHSNVLLSSPAAWLDQQHLLLYLILTPVASFSIVSSNQPEANPIHA